MSHFEDNNHAIHTGMLMGLLSKKGIAGKPTVDERGDYTPVIQIDVPLDKEGTFIPIYIRVLATEGFE